MSRIDNTSVLCSIFDINTALANKGLHALNSEQVEAMHDETQCFDMVDDFEARLGLSESTCAEVRSLLVDFFTC